VDTERAEFSVDSFVARQPVFDSAGGVWGYEILYRDGFTAVAANFPNAEEATLSVMASLFLCREQDLKAGKKVLINFDEKNIRDGAPLALPAANIVVQVPEAAAPSPELLRALADLKAEGYAIAVDDFEARPGAEELLALCDLVIIDTLGREPQPLFALAHKAKGPGRLLVAKRVEDLDSFEKTKGMGFTHFQGFFFQRPKIIPGRRFSSSEASRLRLLYFTQQDDPDFKDLAEAIKTDVSISYRLLLYLNSPLFMFHIHIQSIEQALLLLGWKQVRSWLRVLILSDLTPSGASSELPFLSVQRGRFFELAGKQAGCKPAERESLFMLGLFSLLESLLRMPMANILQHLPLDQELADALLGQDNGYAPWLGLARAFEAGDWAGVEASIALLNLDKVAVARCYSEALDWANRFLDHSTGASAA
jgi:c-di-GMP phosphodiesterase